MLDYAAYRGRCDASPPVSSGQPIADDSDSGKCAITGRERNGTGKLTIYVDDEVLQRVVRHRVLDPPHGIPQREGMRKSRVHVSCDQDIVRGPLECSHIVRAIRPDAALHVGNTDIETVRRGDRHHGWKNMQITRSPCVTATGMTPYCRPVLGPGIGRSRKIPCPRENRSRRNHFQFFVRRVDSVPPRST